MSPAPDRARALALRAVEVATGAGAGQAEALVIASASALTRYADNRIHQNVLTEDTGVSVRAVLGRRVGVASTNRVDDEGLRACCAAAVEAARHAPEDPDFPGLPAPRPVVAADRTAKATRDLDATRRAVAVGAIVEACASSGLTAAGTVSVSDDAAAVANSLGVDSAMGTTACRATVVSTGPDGASGWASFAGNDASDLDPDALGREAASLALRSARPGRLQPGEYTVVLAPDAVADIVQFLGWYGCSAKAVDEGRSF
ncbi:MAG TPA: DNA gyrase modulator, partial [Coriobacteriia bacterium]